MTNAPSAPTLSACFMSLRDSSVQLLPQPARTGMRLLTAFTTVAMTSSCSSWLSVGDSPVVAQGTMAFVPEAMCHSTNSRTSPWSIEPFFLKGVMRATIEPLKMLRIALVFSLMFYIFVCVFIQFP